MGKTIIANVHCVNVKTYVTDAAFFHKDYGSQLIINGLNLETGTQVHFSLNEKKGNPTPMIGVNEDGVFKVDVPDNLLSMHTKNNDYKLYAFIYCTDETGAWTEHEIEIPVIMRPSGAYENPTDKEVTAFDKVTNFIKENVKKIDVDREQIEKNKQDIEDIKKNGIGAKIDVDEMLDKKSKNPIQNQAVAKEFEKQGGTVEITKDKPQKDNTVLVIDPTAEEIIIYSAEEVDAIIEELKKNGVNDNDGKDYVLTVDDKNEIAEIVKTEISEETVKFTEQTLTDSQKEQARTNIGAVSQLEFNNTTNNFRERITAIEEQMPTKYEEVNSVDEMTDTSKKYVLNGTIWEYGETEVDDTDRNLYDANTVVINQKTDGSTQNGAFLTDFIPIDIGYSDPYNMRVLGLDCTNQGYYPDVYKVVYYDVNKTLLKESYITVIQKDENADRDYTFKIGYNASTGAKETVYNSIKYVRLLCRASSSAITQSQVPTNIIITTSEPKTRLENVWFDTGEEYEVESVTVQTEHLQFVDSVEEMIDSEKNYVLKATGEIWSYQKIVKEYTNMIPKSINADGTIYNDGLGYKEGCRWNSSANEDTQARSITTGFIPVNNGDVIRFQGAYIQGQSASYNTWFCLEDFSKYFGLTPSAFVNNVADNFKPYEYEDGTVKSLSVPNVDGVTIKWVKFTLEGTAKDAIITVNEPIETITTYEFCPTGRYYGTESMQIVTSVEEMVDTSKKYVLEETGTIWYFGASLTPKELYDPESVTLNLRYSGNPPKEATNNLYFSTDYIPVDMSVPNPQLNVFGIGGDCNDETRPIFEKITCFDSEKNAIFARYIAFDSHSNETAFATKIDGGFNILIGVLGDQTKHERYEDIAYIRITVLPTVSTVVKEDANVITSIINPDILEATGSEQWKDSGIVYTGLNKDDLLRLENRTTVSELKIAEVEKKVQELESGQGNSSSTTESVSIPDYWKTEIDSLEPTIRDLFDEGGQDTFAFMWCADFHGKSGYTNSNGAGKSEKKHIGSVVQYTTEKYNIPFFMISGDIMSQSSHTDASKIDEEYKAVWDILSPIDKEKLLLTKGNHDGAWGEAVDINGTATYYLRNIGGKKIYNRIFRPLALDRNRVFGGDGSYYYVDTPQNIRIIMLNGHTTGDDSVDENGWAVYNSMKFGVYGSKQLNWLANEALNTDKRIIVSAHQPLTQSIDGSILSGILNAYNARTSYSNAKDVTSQYWGNGVEDETYRITSVTKDFSGAKGRVIAYFHGHIHKDTMDNASHSFVVASITTAGADVRDSNPEERVPDTATETALDIVIINKGKIDFIRLGAGENRTTTYIEEN